MFSSNPEWPMPIDPAGFSRLHDALSHSRPRPNPNPDLTGDAAAMQLRITQLFDQAMVPVLGAQLQMDACLGSTTSFWATMSTYLVAGLWPRLAPSPRVSREVARAELAYLPRLAALLRREGNEITSNWRTPNGKRGLEATLMRGVPFCVEGSASDMQALMLDLEEDVTGVRSANLDAFHERFTTGQEYWQPRYAIFNELGHPIFWALRPDAPSTIGDYVERSGLFADGYMFFFNGGYVTVAPEPTEGLWCEVELKTHPVDPRRKDGTLNERALIRGRGLRGMSMRGAEVVVRLSDPSLQWATASP